MTDLAVRNSLLTFAEEASATHTIAKGLATTSFVPTSMKGKPDEITAAILFGRELNMDPMTALQTINVIQGRPTLTANAMRGLAMGAGVRFRLDEATETRCTMSAIAPGQDQWTTITWTIDQARKMGLTTKENWKNQPGAMLIARATSQLCRLVAANILIGLPYSFEEMNDLGPSTNDDPEKKTRKISRVKAVVGEEPTVDTFQAHIDRDHEQLGGHEEPKAIEGPAVGITPKTRAAIMAGFGDLFIKDRDARLHYAGNVVGREIHSVNQLSEDEALRVRRAITEDLSTPDTEWPAEVPQ